MAAAYNLISAALLPLRPKAKEKYNYTTILYP
jgi:hypothetical protein